MSEVLQANVFFYIASVATVLFFFLVALILFEVYKIAKVVRRLIERVDKAGEAVAEDAAHVRQLIATGGLVSTIFSLVFGASKKKRHKQSADD